MSIFQGFDYSVSRSSCHLKTNFMEGP